MSLELDPRPGSLCSLSLPLGVQAVGAAVIPLDGAGDQQERLGLKGKTTLSEKGKERGENGVRA